MMYMVDILVPIAICCVLPIVVVWLYIRERINASRDRTRIVLAAIEKNPNLDVEELIRHMAPKGVLLKEKLLKKQQRSMLSSVLGVGLIVYGIWLGCTEQGGTSDAMASIWFGLILLGIGVTLYVNYRLSRKMLANEIKAEEERAVKDIG